MTRNVFSPEALADFAALYPVRPGKIAHGLVGHPLFEIESLVALAQRMKPETVEYNRADLPIGIDPADIPDNGLSAAETIRSIEENGSWMVLKFVEQDPLYRALLEETLAELRSVTGPATGPMLNLEGFIFVSSPDAVTPFHFDPEHNILLQIRGSKVMTVLPARDESIVAGTHHETFHIGGHRNLPWQDEFTAKGEPFALSPGEAIHVPVKAPHWVKNGPALSISFSITWRSRWSYQEADARGMNHVLRKLGVAPRAPKAFPDHNDAKSVAYRMIRKAKGILGKG